MAERGPSRGRGGAPGAGLWETFSPGVCVVFLTRHAGTPRAGLGGGPLFHHGGAHSIFAAAPSALRANR
jgi:hypothetical protein